MLRSSLGPLAGSHLWTRARAQVYYVRARAMLVVPKFVDLPAGAVRALVARALRVLKKDDAQAAKAAATCVEGMLEQNKACGREYFGRVRTG